MELMTAFFKVAQGMISSSIGIAFLKSYAAIVWNYVGELIFNMLVLVGCNKMSDRLIRELMGLDNGHQRPSVLMLYSPAETARYLKS